MSKLRPIFFTDSELREVTLAIHNFTRKGQKRREIYAQGRAAEKVDTCVRQREYDRTERTARRLATKRIPQETQILNWLKAGNSITPAEAYERFNTLRLGGRIFDLREKGWNIESEDFKTPSGKHVARYHLVVEPVQTEIAFQPTKEFSR